MGWGGYFWQRDIFKSLPSFPKYITDLECNAKKGNPVGQVQRCEPTIAHTTTREPHFHRLQNTMEQTVSRIQMCRREASELGGNSRAAPAPKRYYLHTQWYASKVRGVLGRSAVCWELFCVSPLSFSPDMMVYGLHPSNLSFSCVLSLSLSFFCALQFALFVSDGQHAWYGRYSQSKIQTELALRGMTVQQYLKQAREVGEERKHALLCVHASS
jgi:XRCC4 N-terminal domain